MAYGLGDPSFTSSNINCSTLKILGDNAFFQSFDNKIDLNIVLSPSIVKIGSNCFRPISAKDSKRLKNITIGD
jgi:hypothetical protein